jgi:uncharacterized protein YbbC (DUF1343 family)
MSGDAGRVTLGSERLIASGALGGQKVGVVCNPASVDADLRHVVDRLTEADGVTLAAIFGPQHGFRADLQDNMIESPHGRDPRRQVPVHSLYSETREPTAGMLRDLDVLIVDLQDVGTRVYTFAYTMANCLRAAARHGVPVIVCDRPNPVGGERVEGPVLEEAFRSFVGQFPVPLRHGLTIAELARLFNEAFGLGAPLDVVQMEGWRREMRHDETGLPWVMPSPNLPTLDSALVYPGMVLLEGTNLSEGRGTTRPFELCGAPWIDGEALAAGLEAQALPGVRFRPVFFEPTFQKHAGLRCGGCQLHVQDRAAFRPIETAIAILEAFRRMGPEKFAWRQPPYEYEAEKMPIDILYGSDALRHLVETDTPLDIVAGTWQPALERFLEIRSHALLY